MVGLKLTTKFREKRNCDWWVFLNVKTITGWYATDFGGLSWRVQPLLTKVRFGECALTRPINMYLPYVIYISASGQCNACADSHPSDFRVWPIDLALSVL